MPEEILPQDNITNPESIMPTPIPVNIPEHKSRGKKIFLFSFAALIFIFVICAVLFLKYSHIISSGKQGVITTPSVINKFENTQPIIIGGILPLTTDAASFGLPIQQAAILAQNEINKNGGIDGRTIKIIWKDGKCDKDVSAAAAKQLIEDDKIAILIGGACSSEFLASAPLAQEKGIVSFTSSATSPKISSLGEYIFRTAPSDMLAGKAAAQYAYNKWNAKKMGIITENKDYTLGLREVFSDNFKSLGGTITLDETFDTGTTDFSLIAEKAIKSELDAVYILPQTPIPGVLLIKALKDQGITAKILTAEVLLIRDALSQQGDILEGVTGIEILFDENREKAKNFMEIFRKEFNQEPTYPGFMAGMYDIIYLIKEGYAAGSVTSDQLSAYLYNLKDYNGVSGVLTFDSNGDPVLTYSIKLISNHKATEVDTYKPSI